MNENNTFRSIVSIDNEAANNCRASFPDVYVPNGYIDILRTSYVLDNRALHGEMMMAYESPVCTEVDSVEELEYLEYQITRRGSILLDYLEKNNN